MNRDSLCNYNLIAITAEPRVLVGFKGYIFTQAILFVVLILQMKCHKYWPEEDTVTQYGPVHVAAKEKIELADFTIRSFDLKNVSVYF